MLKLIITTIILPISLALSAQMNGEFNDLSIASQNPLEVISLDLSKQKLKSIPAEVFLFENLEELNLSKNRIELIPSDISKLKKLKYLNVSRNVLSSIPPEIAALTHLNTLILNQNEITRLCPEIGMLKELKTLDLWGNLLDELPSSISNLKSSLETLDMRVIYMSAEKQQAIIDLLPYTQIYFSYSCNCKN